MFALISKYLLLHVYLKGSTCMHAQDECYLLRIYKLSLSLIKFYYPSTKLMLVLVIISCKSTMIILLCVENYHYDSDNEH